MKTTLMKTTLTKDLSKKKIYASREFASNLETVWRAWTDSKILDKWWAPKPWKANTKKMDFREGGSWLYAMEGPDGSKHWSRADFKSIVPHKSFEGDDYFCDENGKKNSEMPMMHWKNVFTSTNNGTRVDIEITFDKEEDLKTIVEMGFEQGFTAAHGNLDELLAE